MLLMMLQNCVSDIVSSIISKPSLSSSKCMGSSVDSNLEPGSGGGGAVATEMSSSNMSTMSSSSSASSGVIGRTSMMIALGDLNRLVVYMRQLSRDLGHSAAGGDQAGDEAIKWLRAVLPYDYVKNTLESVAAHLNQAAKTGGRHLGAPYNSESAEVIAAIFKEAHSEPDQILVVNISEKGMECPGMLSEEKVITECGAVVESTLVRHQRRRVRTPASTGAGKLLNAQLSVASSSCSAAAASAPAKAASTGASAAKKHHQFKGSSSAAGANSSGNANKRGTCGRACQETADSCMRACDV